MGEVRPTLEGVRSVLFSTFSRETLHETIAFVFMASTKQLLYAGGNASVTMIRRSDPEQRDCLY